MSSSLCHYPADFSHTDWSLVGQDANEIHLMCTVVTDLNLWEVVKASPNIAYDVTKPLWQDERMSYHSGSSGSSVYGQVHLICTLGWKKYVDECQKYLNKKK